MNFDDYLKLLQVGRNLNRRQAKAFLGLLIDDTSLADAEIAEALTVLTDKSVTAEEVCGFVDAMRARMVTLPVADEAVIDTCGTGGDKAGTFNISTAAAILLAAGGIKVAKHGNRAATSRSGSADVLEALGVPVDLAAAAAVKSLNEHNFVFLFAPLYHPSLKRLTVIRRQLGFPTVFNLLGPLLNPAGVKRQVVGTFSVANAELLAEVMSRMDYRQAIVLTSDDGLDEAGLTAPVSLFEIKGEAVDGQRIIAQDYGLEAAAVAELQGGDADHNASLIKAAFQPSENLNAHQRVIVLNAGIGFYAAGAAPNIQAGIDRAATVLKQGLAAAKLAELSR